MEDSMSAIIQDALSLLSLSLFLTAFALWIGAL